MKGQIYVYSYEHEKFQESTRMVPDTNTLFKQSVFIQIP